MEKACRGSSHVPPFIMNYPKWEDISCWSQQEENYPAHSKRKCNYFTSPTGERKTFFLSSKSEWKRDAALAMENTCSSATEKLSSPELLLSSNELSFFSLLLTFFPCPACLILKAFHVIYNSSEYLCQMRCCLIHESFNKVNRSSNLLS